MLATRPPRPSLALLAFAACVIAGCSHSSDTAVDAAAAAPLAPTPPPAPRAQMGMMMGETGMIMLDGFCGAEDGDSASAVHVDLIVNGEAAQRASRVMINVVSAAPGDLKAELVAGRDAHTMCGGHARHIYIGGSSMFLGNPTLTLSSAVPVTVAARSTTSKMLGASIDVKPGQRDAKLMWDAPSDAKP
ncbi:MAG: hypothetical protein ACREMU_13220 [Gemmatimonadaceae bacterium]